MEYAIKINAMNNTNGNPRRAYLVFDETGYQIDTIDEGYRGNYFLIWEVL